MNALALDGQTDQGLSAWISPARTAVLVIDMQVDFAAPHGSLSEFVNFAAVDPALRAAERLVEAARKAEAPVVFVGLMTSPETDSPSWRERMRRLGGESEGENGLCRAGAPGADFYGPKPLPGERVVFKTRYSGFYGTDLDAVLKAIKVDTLVVCGLTTECCVDCTVRDAFHLDYHVFVAADACAAYEPDFHDPPLKSLAANCAILTTVAAVADAWAEAPHG